MRIREYSYTGDRWDFKPVILGDFNLIVGDSGVGKTRFLNTLFNLGTYVAQSKLSRDNGEWKISLECGTDTYRWEILHGLIDDKPTVIRESLYLDDRLLIDRTVDHLVFEDNELPKMPRDVLSISLLKEEPDIAPVFEGFSLIMRRKFFEDALVSNSGYYAIGSHNLDIVGKSRDLRELFRSELALNPKLFVLEKYFPDIYAAITRQLMETFEFISGFQIVDSSYFPELRLPGNVPVFCIKENNVDGWIRLPDMSSGMQKMILILTDLLTMPDGGVYLLDEYENSLGITPLGFLPELLSSNRIQAQVLMTSHHPYIIQNMPVDYWYLARRKGSEVQFDFGEELIARYGVSSQEKYFQLINDPHYSEGIE